MTVRKTRMTAEQRKAHAAEVLRKEEQRWQAEKHRRILHVLHRASELGFQTSLGTELGGPGDIRVVIDGTNEELFGWREFFVGSISKRTMSLIEHDLAVVEDNRNEELIRQRKRQAILDRLTDEERHLLGL